MLETLNSGLSAVLTLAATVGGLEYGAFINQYGALTWKLWGDSGMMCLVSDNIKSGNNAGADRYRVSAFKPTFLDGVFIIHRSDGVYESRSVVKEPGHESMLYKAVPLDESGDWFVNNGPMPELGKACLDGGLEGAVDSIEAEHRITVQPWQP